MSRMTVRGLAAFAVLLALLAGTIGGTSAAHNGNNKAELTGRNSELDATGTVIVNYSEGKGTFNGTVTVMNLEGGMTYSFFVSGAASGSGVAICSGVANDQGTFTCSEQGLSLPGFTTADVREGTTVGGELVAQGLFARRGNCRDEDQAGSLCMAPGQDKKAS